MLNQQGTRQAQLQQESKYILHELLATKFDNDAISFEILPFIGDYKYCNEFQLWRLEFFDLLCSWCCFFRHQERRQEVLLNQSMLTQEWEKRVQYINEHTATSIYWRSLHMKIFAFFILVILTPFRSNKRTPPQPPSPAKPCLHETIKLPFFY